MTPSVLSDRRVSARENREHFPYWRSAKMPHVLRVVSRAGMAPKSSRIVASPKTHSGMAQATSGMYMTYDYQAHTYIAQWHEKAKSDLVERAYIRKLGILPFINMNWADVN